MKHEQTQGSLHKIVLFLQFRFDKKAKNNFIIILNCELNMSMYLF